MSTPSSSTSLSSSAMLRHPTRRIDDGQRADDGHDPPRQFELIAGGRGRSTRGRGLHSPRASPSYRGAPGGTSCVHLAGEAVRGWQGKTMPLSTKGTRRRPGVEFVARGGGPHMPGSGGSPTSGVVRSHGRAGPSSWRRRLRSSPGPCPWCRTCRCSAPSVSCRPFRSRCCRWSRRRGGRGGATRARTCGRRRRRRSRRR